MDDEGCGKLPCRLARDVDNAPKSLEMTIQHQYTTRAPDTEPAAGSAGTFMGYVIIDKAGWRRAARMLVSTKVIRPTMLHPT